jgi:large subunit ribosomal protein L13
MKTVFETKEAAISSKKWFVVDAENQVVGRLASRIASILRGKENPRYTPHTDTGDFVIVLNAGKVRFTGNKMAGKLYRHHTGFVGGVKEITAEALLKKKPEEVIKEAVWGMLPKGPLGRAMYSKLKVYTGTEHPHSAQQPQTLTLNS